MPSASAGETTGYSIGRVAPSASVSNAAVRDSPQTTRNGLPSTSTGSVATSGPTTNATRYVDIGIVSANRTATLSTPTPPSVPPATGVRSSSAALEITSRSPGTTRVIPKTALASGSSQQGKARRASVASICVVASTRSTPASSVNVDR